MNQRLSDNPAATRIHSCVNRSRTALSSSYIVPAGYKGDGSKRFMTIRTPWNDADSGRCQYASTPEGKSDPGCARCMWRVSQ
ncbi:MULTISPECIES: hypothetical protein [unclassified Marinobacter]|uniref:hypothetical protein n=1 Tax=unclassified Marinobacter TaxID=83889 RepID=UPI001925F504|nr:MULTISPECIES: hypothetical protein [unclassified Marinobacter]MBL3825137.1 hypothetical protein [Marinobacter sp. MC3]MBL3893659.1 hypothetical protein [Marinobacter sp. MW3]